MTEVEAQGVAAMVRLLNRSATREVAQRVCAELNDQELADVLDVLSSSDRARGGEGAVLLEEAARRLRSAEAADALREVQEIQQ